MSSPDELKRWADDVFRPDTALNTFKRIAASFEQNPAVSIAQLGATAAYCIHIALEGIKESPSEVKGEFITTFLTNLATITAEHHIYLFPFVSNSATIAGNTSPAEIDAAQARPAPPPRKEDS